MSFEELRVLGAVIDRAIRDIDPHWMEEEDGVYYIRGIPGQRIKIRHDQVKNNAGGYVFSVSRRMRIRRFLILGCSGGTYYSIAYTITSDNMRVLMDTISRGKASMILEEIRAVSQAGRNPKQKTIMMALALCARFLVYSLEPKAPAGTAGAHFQAYISKMHHDAFALINEVCRIPTHLFMFIGYCEAMASGLDIDFDGDNKHKAKSTGWGRGMRKAIANWYLSRDPEQLAMLITKYRNREGWTHRDVLRLAHPMTDDLVHKQIFNFATKKRLSPLAITLPEGAREKYTAEQLEAEANSAALRMIKVYASLNADSSDDEIVRAIKEHGLVREHVPTNALNYPAVWRALLGKMPMTAMIRNLAKMQVVGILEGKYLDALVKHLTNEAYLKKARVHPIQILLAKAVYDEGHGERGSLEWSPQKVLSDALETAFYASFTNVEPTYKRFCLAFDISSSMCTRIGGTCISARTASAAIGLNLIKIEPLVECVGFCERTSLRPTGTYFIDLNAAPITELPYDENWTLQSVSNHMDGLRMGATDCAAPMLWAMEKKKEFDVFVVFTDNETHHGKVHPFVALRKYRQKMNIDAKLVVVGMTATEFTIADPSDSGMLDVVGFDSAVPELIANFVRGHV